MELSGNPLAVLTFISAPAVLTNASCVLLFGTGNRYGRAIDRVHELFDSIQAASSTDREELELRVKQLEAGERRTALIVRALTCFYTAVAGFVASTLISLIGALAASAGFAAAHIVFAVAFLLGCLGVGAIVLGAMMLARESRYSFAILQDERKVLTQRAQRRLATMNAG